MSTSPRPTLKSAEALALSFAVLMLPLQAQEQHVPAIRTTTRLVQLNVVVLDKHGQPVSDLSQSDFQVFDNGLEQNLSHFSISSTPAGSAPSAREPLVLTNRLRQPGETPGTVTIILVDELIDQDAQASYYRTILQSIRSQVRKVLATLPPGQQVALCELRAEGVVVAQELTDDPAALVATVKTIGAGLLEATFSPVRAKGSGPDTAQDFRDSSIGSGLATPRKTSLTEDLRRELLKEAFQGIAHHLQGTPARKNIVWISPAFPSIVTGLDPVLMGKERDAINPVPGAMLPVPEFAETQGYYQQLRAIARQMSNGNISVYPMDVKGLAGGTAGGPIKGPTGGMDPRAPMLNTTAAYVPPAPGSVSGLFGERQAMELFASETGGRAFYDSNGLDHDLQKVLAEGRVAYLLGYYPGDTAWDGKYHHIEVRLKRPGLSVLCRKGYFAMDEPLPKDSDAALRDAAKGMLEWSGLGVTLNVSSNPLEWFQQEMVVKLDTQEIHFENKDGRWRAQLDVVFAQLSKDGRILESVKDHLDLALLPETYSEAATQGWFYPKTVDVNPKAEKLRVVVGDLSTGAIGSVSVPVYHRKGA